MFGAASRKDPFRMMPDLRALIPILSHLRPSTPASPAVPSAPPFSQGFGFGGGIRPRVPVAASVPAFVSVPTAPDAARSPSALGGKIDEEHTDILREASTRNPTGSASARDDTVYARSESDRPASHPVQSSGKPSRFGQQALAVARQEVGVAEQPPRSNQGPRVNQYQRGKGGQPWCAHFVSWCVEQVGASPFGHLASVSALRDWGKAKGIYHSVDQSDPLVGDIFTMARYDQTGKLVGGHTGFVSSYDAKSCRIRTVEGNAGDKVIEGSYAIASIDGFIRLSDWL